VELSGRQKWKICLRVVSEVRNKERVITTNSIKT